MLLSSLRSMKLSFLLLILLSLSDAAWSRPLPTMGRKSISIPWKKYLPTLGAIGLLGSIVGIVFLGTKADGAFRTIKTLKTTEAETLYLSLPAKDQNYLIQRMSYIGESLKDEEKDQVEAQDLIHGWPKMEMPDTKGLNKSTRRELKSIYGRLKNALDKVATTKQTHQEATEAASAAEKENREAQYHAALIAATDWKKALEQAKGQMSGGNIATS